MIPYFFSFFFEQYITNLSYLFRFYQRVVIDGKPCPTGEGKSKKEAKQNAAKKALESLSEPGDQGSVDAVR